MSGVKKGKRTTKRIVGSLSEKGKREREKGKREKKGSVIRISLREEVLDAEGVSLDGVHKRDVHA